MNGIKMSESGNRPCEKAGVLPHLSVADLEQSISRDCAPHEVTTYGYGAHTLYFLPEAAVELDNWVCFGRRRTSNAYEQQYIGMGHTFLDEENRILTVVSRILPVLSASRGPAHAQMVCDGNDGILGILANERRIQNELEERYNTDENGCAITPFLRYGPSTVVLMGHTHPDSGCTFSAVDYRSNYSTHKFPMVSFVCDPIRKDMRAMVGVACEPMKVVVCRPGQPEEPKREKDRLPCAVEQLWQQLSAVVGLLLQCSGVSGKLECYRDPRGRTHMRMFLTSRPGMQARTEE